LNLSAAKIPGCATWRSFSGGCDDGGVADARILSALVGVRDYDAVVRR